MRRALLSLDVGVRDIPLRSALRLVSEIQGSTVVRGNAWAEPGKPPTRPNPLSGHPTLRLRKTSVEWKAHHGHGVRHGTIGASREISDFEYADGTPAPISIRRYALKHHQDSMMVQLIKAGARVERDAELGYLPRIPGTPEQRDWDPEIPLFLEDADEHGKAPVWHYTNRNSGQDLEAARQAHIEEKYAKQSRTSPSLVNAHNQETLEPNTMFASYDPSAFISEPVRLREQTRPQWSRRRWALTNEFLVSKTPQPKNTIKDE